MLPVVVFIDDLDRCTPDKAMQVLEVTNFLVNAGECLVVLGVAKERVVKLVCLANRNVPSELAIDGEAAQAPETGSGTFPDHAAA